MSNIKVSVIIPVYNSSEYISQTLNSVINQDFDSFEIIIIDDGSTDNSLEIIQNTLKNTNILHKILKQKNQGVSITRNRGIDEAKGDYLIFVDSDDIITPNHISNLYNGKTDFSLTQLKKDTKFQVYNYQNNSLSTDEFIEMELKMQIPFNFTQLMYKTSIIKKNNIKFPNNIVYGEDTHFALEALMYGCEIAISNEVTYHYIQHSNSAIQNTEFKRFEIVDVFENLKNIYKKNNKTHLANLITTSRIPKAIFGNMNFFFYNNYDFNEIMEVMREKNLLDKLSKYEGDRKYKLKIKLFLINPKVYYKLWMKFKKSID